MNKEENVDKKEKKVRILKKYSEDFKKHVVAEIESEKLSQNAAGKHYNVPHQTISDWVKKYGTVPTQYIEVVMKDQSEEIARLKETIANLTIKLGVTECALEEACKATGKTLKKNVFTQELEIIDNETGKICQKYAL